MAKCATHTVIHYAHKNIVRIPQKLFCKSFPKNIIDSHKRTCNSTGTHNTPTLYSRPSPFEM